MYQKYPFIPIQRCTLRIRADHTLASGVSIHLLAWFPYMSGEGSPGTKPSHGNTACLLPRKETGIKKKSALSAVETDGLPAAAPFIRGVKKLPHVVPSVLQCSIPQKLLFPITCHHLHLSTAGRGRPRPFPGGQLGFSLLSVAWAQSYYYASQIFYPPANLLLKAH